MQRVVVPSVFELLANSPGDLEVQIRRDRFVAPVKEVVDTAPWQETILRLMTSPSLEGGYELLQGPATCVLESRRSAAGKYR